MDIGSVESVRIYTCLVHLYLIVLGQRRNLLIVVRRYLDSLINRRLLDLLKRLRRLSYELWIVFDLLDFGCMDLRGAVGGALVLDEFAVFF